MAVYTSESSAGTVGLAAAAGGLSAVFADLIQKGDASAVFELTANVNKLGDLLYPPNLGTWPGVPVAGVGLGLLLVSIILAFMSEARSRTSAFYSGASVLTVLMTLVPYTQALPAPSDMTVNKSAMLREDSMIVPGLAGAGDDGHPGYDRRPRAQSRTGERPEPHQRPALRPGLGQNLAVRLQRRLVVLVGFGDDLHVQPVDPNLPPDDLGRAGGRPVHPD